MASSAKRRKKSESEHVKMDQIINLGIPHIGEKIFESIDTKSLVRFLSVSNAWKELAGNVLFKRHRGQILVACKKEPSEVVKILIERSETEELNVKQQLDCLTPFMIACEFDRHDVVKSFLQNSEKKAIELNSKRNAN